MIRTFIKNLNLTELSPRKENLKKKSPLISKRNYVHKHSGYKNSLQSVIKTQEKLNKASQKILQTLKDNSFKNTSENNNIFDAVNHIKNKRKIKSVEKKVKLN